MKTPEQIARETFAMMHSQAAEECENEILGLIAEGIEADRAQRRIILTLGDSRVWVKTPAEVYEQMHEMRDLGVSLEEWEWEK